VAAGPPLGGICWPLILDHLFDTIGFPWAVRVAGFICLGVLVPSCWLIIGRKSQLSGSQADLSAPKLDLATILQDAKYVVFSVGMFIGLWGMFPFFFYLPVYGHLYGMDEDESGNLVTYLHIGSLVSSIVIGFAADKLGR
jgi:cyanate permease